MIANRIYGDNPTGRARSFALASGMQGHRAIKQVDLRRNKNG